MFKKRLSDLKPADIQRLIDEEWQEGLELEFKETLPAKAGKTDAWISGQKTVGDYARNKLMEEIVAFSNAYGGTLVVGIAETKEKPPRASEVRSLPQCAELAERLSHQCRDCIDPQIPLLEVSSVDMDGEGNGVVVVRVPESRAAPHRHSQTRECYIRRGDRSEKMHMREIQGLTLNAYNRSAEIENKFSGHRSDFEADFISAATGRAFAFGMAVSLIPITALSLERVHGIAGIRPGNAKFEAGLGKARFSLQLPRGVSTWRPAVRSTVADAKINGFSLKYCVSCDGEICLRLFFSDDSDDERMRHLPPEWVIALFSNGLCAVELIRSHAGAHGLEYAAGVDLNVHGHPAVVQRYSDSIRANSLGALPVGPTAPPRYSIGDREEFQAVTTVFERDFMNSIGVDPDEDLCVNFEAALDELLSKK